MGQAERVEAARARVIEAAKAHLATREYTAHLGLARMTHAERMKQATAEGLALRELGAAVDALLALEAETPEVGTSTGDLYEPLESRQCRERHNGTWVTCNRRTGHDGRHMRCSVGGVTLTSWEDPR